MQAGQVTVSNREASFGCRRVESTSAPVCGQRNVIGQSIIPSPVHARKLGVRMLRMIRRVELSNMEQPRASALRTSAAAIALGGELEAASPRICCIDAMCGPDLQVSTGEQQE